MSDKRLGRAPALFDGAAFTEDLKRAGDTGREVALAARNSFEESGIPLEELRACDEEGPAGAAGKRGPAGAEGPEGPEGPSGAAEVGDLEAEVDELRHQVEQSEHLFC